MPIIRNRRNVAELREANRADEMKAVLQFIDTCDFEELARIVEEIRCCHDCLMVFDSESKTVKKVESVGLNGETIQLNVEEWNEQEKA